MAAGYDLHTHLAPLIGAGDGADEPKPGPPGLYRPDLLVAALDDAGLQQAVVAVPPPFFHQDLPAQEAATWVRLLNDGLRRAIEPHERLIPLAYLPLEHPALAVAEYERVRAEPGWAGVTAAAGGASVSLADSAFEPLWELLAADRRLLQLHPGMPSDPRMEQLYLHNLVGFPMETTIAAAQLVLGDVLRRHAQMRVLLLHCGAAMPALAGRWQRGVDTHRPGLATDVEPPLDAVRRFFVDALCFHPAVLDLALEVVGGDRIVLGSDWPFPMGSDAAMDLVRGRGPAFLHRVAVTNAEAALGLRHN